MAKKTTGSAHPWHQIEEQAFHAFREWPLWLVLRQRELQRQLHGSAAGQSRAAGAGEGTAKPRDG